MGREASATRWRMALANQKKLAASEIREAWRAYAASRINEERQRQKLTYKQLSKRLADIGVNIDPKTLNNRILGGQFTHVLALQVLHVLGVREMRVPDRAPRLKASR